MMHAGEYRHSEGHEHKIDACAGRGDDHPPGAADISRPGFKNKHIAGDNGNQSGGGP